MKKVTLALAVLLANLTISEAEIGDTMKEVMFNNMFSLGKPMQYHGCPAVQFTSAARGNVTAIFSPKTNREIAIVLDARHQLGRNGDIVQPWNSYGRWQIVQNDPKMATWHLKHPRFGDLWMVVTANAHVAIIATPEGLEALGLHATKVH